MHDDRGEFPDREGNLRCTSRVSDPTSCVISRLLSLVLRRAQVDVSRSPGHPVDGEPQSVLRLVASDLRHTAWLGGDRRRGVGHRDSHRRATVRAAHVGSGSLAAGGMFLVTLSFLFNTPNVGESAPFLLKDLTLLGAAVWTAGEAIAAS